MAVETSAREAPAVESAPIHPASQAAIWALIVLVIVNIINFYDRNVAGALTEPIRKEFHLTDTQIGWLGTVFTLLYAVIGLPLGRLADGGDDIGAVGLEPPAERIAGKCCECELEAGD